MFNVWYVVSWLLWMGKIDGWVGGWWVRGQRSKVKGFRVEGGRLRGREAGKLGKHEA